MKLWPIESYEIETQLSVADAIFRLQSVTAPNRSFGRATIRRFFEGRVTDSAFELRPVIYSGASFMPELHGSFESRPGGTTVRVEMVPGRATLTVLAVLAAFLVVSMYDHNALRVLLTTSSYVLFGWVTALAGCWLDGGRARQKLHSVLLPPAKPIDVVIGPSGYDYNAEAN